MSRILVVDDVKLFRHLESAVLAWRGHQIEEAADGEEALEKIRANPPDLVLLDLNMPGISGHEVCRQVKADRDLASLPVIIVTSSNRDEDIREAVQCGCDDYLTKPIDEAALVSKVEIILGLASKRRFPRVPASMQVSFEDFRGIFFEYARDLSRTGVYIEMTDPLPVGSRLRLKFSLPPPFGQTVQAYGRVVRSVAGGDEGFGGIGVAFIHVDAESLGSIDALVAGQDAEELTRGLMGRLSLQLEEAIESQAYPFSQPPPASDHVLLDEQEQVCRSLDELQKDHLRLSALLAMYESLLGAGEPLTAVGDVLTNLVGASGFGVFLYDSAEKRLLPVRGNRLSASTVARLATAPDVLEAIDRGTVQTPTPPRCLEGCLETVLAVAPVPWPAGGDKPMGLICILELFPQKKNLSLDDQRLLEKLGRQLGRRLVGEVALSRAGQLALGDLKTALC